MESICTLCFNAQIRAGVTVQTLASLLRAGFRILFM